MAICKGVESVILFLRDMMAPLSNLINSSITDTEPWDAAMWALVFPFYYENVIIVINFAKAISITSRLYPSKVLNRIYLCCNRYRVGSEFQKNFNDFSFI